MTGEPAAPAQAPQPAPVVTDDGLPQPQRRRAIVTILLGIAVAVLDGTIVTLALPRIATDFHATAASSIWIVNAYQLAVLVTLIPCAALGDRFGYRRVYLCGVATMLVTSLGAMLAPSMPALIAWRAVQGMGAAGIMGVNAALVRLTYPRHLLGRGMALNSVTVAVAAVAGPTQAAAILSHTSWHWLFGINLPLGLGLLWLGQRSLPPHRSPTPARLHPLDVLLNAAMFSLVFLGVEQLGTRAGAGSLDARAVTLAVALLLGGLVVGVVFVRGQLRRDVQDAEGHRAVDAQLAARRALQSGNLGFRFLDFEQAALAALEEGAPGFGQAQAARGAMEQACAQAILQTGDVLADHRL